MDSSRFIIGIDLGTTSCALSYIDCLAEYCEPKNLAITQWQNQGLIERTILPSFCYIAKTKEREQYKLPLATTQDDYLVGSLAQERLISDPDLVIHSAKSWLCHTSVDREAKILPWHSDSVLGDKRLSPVFVSSLYLSHLKDIWNHTIGAGHEDYRFEKQKVVITVPASFDEVATYLTLEASKIAGFGDAVVLCEEPQAAFYDWLQRQGFFSLREKDTSSASLTFSNSFVKLAQDKQRILVVDIGGGTTDFCLFESRLDKDRRDVSIRRIAVSEHILLGGDNIDLALANLAEKKLMAQGLTKLSGAKWALLVAECRVLKEKALQASSAFLDQTDKLYHLSFQAGSGSRLFSQTKTINFSLQEIAAIVSDHFFPICTADILPLRLETKSNETGLPFADDSAVTHHLAAFLRASAVDAVLYTGGSLKPEFLRDRLTQVISGWQGFSPLVLVNDALELAVSRGASVFGLAQVQKSTLVHAGYSRSLYIKVTQGTAKSACYLCIVPKDFSADQVIELAPPGLHAVLGQVVRFELFSSLLRADAIGDLVSIDAPEIRPVAMLQSRMDLATKKKNGLLPISLKIHLSPSGLLEMSCLTVDEGLVERGLAKSFRLNFSLNEQTEIVEMSSRAEHKPQSGLMLDNLTKAQAEINRFFGSERSVIQNPSSLPYTLEKIFALPKKDWDLMTLRSLWPVLREGMHRRSRSEQHELTWLSLAGYVLRPGFGESLDSFRVAEVLSLVTQGPIFSASPKVKNQWWIFWRRLAGGLDKKTQDLLFAKNYPLLKRQEASPELILLLGSLERVDMQRRIGLGQWLCSEILSSSIYREQKIWALTRIANRLPLYGGPESIVRPSFVIPWLESLFDLDWTRAEFRSLINFFCHAGRLINDREFDLPEEWMSKILTKLESVNAPSSLSDKLRKFMPQDSQTISLLLGDALPIGLTILAS